MSSRGPTIIATVATMMVIIALCIALAAHSADSAPKGGNPLSLQPDFADKLDFFDTQRAFEAGTLTRVKANSSGDGGVVVLDASTENQFPRRGVWISPIVQAEFNFQELLPSYNAYAPPGTGVRLQMRVRDAKNGKWSPWLYFGRWGRTVAGRGDDQVVTSFAGGRVETDVLLLHRPADAYQVRVALQSLTPDISATPVLRRVAVCYSGPVSDAQARAKFLAPVATPLVGAKVLKVPFIPQGDAPKPLIGEVCSPTSMTMVSTYGGAARPLTENALAIYDDEANIFGNWNRAVQRAGELGLDAWLARFRNWDQVRAMIAINQPVIASIRFERGVMPSNPIYQENDGHLIVIKGFTSEGDVIVNDPASRDKGDGVVYKASELGNAWFGAGGVGYIIRPRGAPRMASEVPTTVPSGPAK